MLAGSCFFVLTPGCKLKFELNQLLEWINKYELFCYQSFTLFTVKRKIKRNKSILQFHSSLLPAYLAMWLTQGRPHIRLQEQGRRVWGPGLCRWRRAADPGLLGWPWPLGGRQGRGQDQPGVLRSVLSLEPCSIPKDRQQIHNTHLLYVSNCTRVQIFTDRVQQQVDQCCLIFIQSVRYSLSLSRIKVSLGPLQNQCIFTSS